MAYDPNNLVKVFEAGDPFKDDPPEAEPYWAAVGRVSVMWGRFEQMLEQIISIISLLPDAPQPPQSPRLAWKRKLDQLKDLCRDTPSANHIHDDARSLVSRAKVLGQKRHAITHSNWQRFISNAPEPTVEFTNIEWDAPGKKYARRPVSLSDLGALLDEIFVLNNDMFEKLFNPAASAAVKASRNPSTPSV